MRRYRTLGVTVLASLLVAIACSSRPAEPPLAVAPAAAPAPQSTVNIVVAPNGTSGIVAHAGDKLQWQTLNPNDPGFTVSFPAQTYNCDSNTPLSVTYRNPQSCTLSNPSGNGEVRFFYQIDTNSAVALKKGGSPAEKNLTPSGPIEFSVVPCKGCAVFLNGNKPKMPRTTGSSDTGFISCQGTTLTVGSVSPNQDGNVSWYSSAGSWTVYFANGTPCTNGSNFANATAPYPSVCSVDSTKKGSYTYNATLDTPSPGCKGAGTLITGK